MRHMFSRLFLTPSIGPLLMLAAAFNFAVLDVLVKLLNPSFRVWDIAFYRFFCSLLILTAIFGRRRNPFRGFSPGLMAVNGIVSSMGFVLLATSIRRIDISTAMALFYSFPAFAALFSALLFRESIAKREIFYVITALCGVMILFEFTAGGDLLGQALGLFAGLSIGLSVALVRKLRQKDGAVAIYLYYCLVGAIVTFPCFIAEPRIPGAAEELMVFAGIILSSILAMLLMNQGLRYCKSWEGGLILTNELILTALFGMCFLGDPITGRFIAGAFLILGSAVALNLGNNRKSPHL